MSRQSCGDSLSLRAHYRFRFHPGSGKLQRTNTHVVVSCMGRLGGHGAWVRGVIGAKCAPSSSAIL